MVLDADTPLVAYDWRGAEIKIGTRVLWHAYTRRHLKRGIGEVMSVSADASGHVLLLGVLWEERDGWEKDRVGKTSFNVRPANCTVWPIQDEDG